MDFNLDGILTDYDKCITLLRDIKLVSGNIALNATLRNHKELTALLVAEQKKKLLVLEKSMLQSE